MRSWRSLPAWSTALLLGGLAYTVLQNALIGFNGGDPIYGYRYGLEFLACATPAFALAAPHAGPVARRLLAPVLAVQFVVIALGAVVERVALRLPAGLDGQRVRPRHGRRAPPRCWRPPCSWCC